MLAGAVLVCVCVAAAVIVMGVAALWRGITGMEEFRVHPGRYAFDSEWVNTDRLLRSLHETDPTGVLAGAHSIFEPQLCKRVAAAYAASPWVRRVKSVEKVFPNRLEVDVELREPWAVIYRRQDDRYYCVDQDGVVLVNGVYRLTKQSLSELLPLVTVEHTRPPRGGECWGDLTVQEGMEMLELYRQRFAGKVPVREIEIEQVALADGTAHARAWLVMDSGTRVVWGRTPSAMSSVAEVSTPRKAAALLALVRKEGDRLGRLKQIDLRWSRPRIE